MYGQGVGGSLLARSTFGLLARATIFEGVGGTGFFFETSSRSFLVSLRPVGSCLNRERFT
jgi:hypothetical protein